jgi:hypothetical protein
MLRRTLTSCLLPGLPPAEDRKPRQVRPSRPYLLSLPPVHSTPSHTTIHYKQAMVRIRHKFTLIIPAKPKPKPKTKPATRHTQPAPPTPELAAPTPSVSSGIPHKHTADSLEDGALLSDGTPVVVSILPKTVKLRKQRKVRFRDDPKEAEQTGSINLPASELPKSAIKLEDNGKQFSFMVLMCTHPSNLCLSRTGFSVRSV